MGARDARWAIRLTLRVLKQAGGRHLEDPGPAGILMLHSQDLLSLLVSYPGWFMLSGREGNGRTPDKEPRRLGSKSHLCSSGAS